LNAQKKINKYGDLSKYERSHPVEQLRRNREALYDAMTTLIFRLIESTDLPDEEKALQQVRSWLDNGLSLYRLNYKTNKELDEHYASKQQAKRC